MKPLIHLNYPINKELLLLESKRAKETAKPWEGGHNYKLDRWLVSYYRSDYLDKIMVDLNVMGETRFYYQEPNYYLPPHRDFGTKCAINFVLSDNYCPININGKDYMYKQALINVQEEHSVKNNNTERLIFKISVFDYDYETVSKIIKYRDDKSV
jgi:hypothetical protein